MSAESKTSVANEAALQLQLEEAAPDDDARTIARIMAEMAEDEAFKYALPCGC